MPVTLNALSFSWPDGTPVLDGVTAAIGPGPNAPRYPTASEPAEAALEREKPDLPDQGTPTPEPRPDPLLPPALPSEDDPAPGDPP